MLAGFTERFFSQLTEPLISAVDGLQDLKDLKDGMETFDQAAITGVSESTKACSGQAVLSFASMFGVRSIADGRFCQRAEN